MDSDSSCRSWSFSSAVVAYRAAAQRDPRDTGFGYLAGDPPTGATGAFLWFASPEELFACLMGTEIALLQFDEAESARLAASVARAVRGKRDLSRVDRDALATAFEGWCEILWIGTFGELCERGGALVKDVRAAFRRTIGLGDHAGPIADDELQSFVGFLRLVGLGGEES